MNEITLTTYYRNFKQIKEESERLEDTQQVTYMTDNSR